MTKKHRTFRSIEPKSTKQHGKYTGTSPMQAAKKCASKRFQSFKKSGKSIPQNIKIFIREATDESKYKVFGYQASRIKLLQPVSICILDRRTNNRRTVTYCYLNKLKSINVPKNIMDK